MSEERMATSILRHCEKQSKRRKSAVWGEVAEFLAVGSSMATEFCQKWQPHLGWRDSQKELPLAGNFVEVMEDAGDKINLMVRSCVHGTDKMGWARKKGSGLAFVLYQPRFWRPV